MMNLTELHQLPTIEKLKIIEALWQDLAEDEINPLSPSWHKTELEKTEAEFLAGTIEIVDWQEAKKELRAQFE